MTCHIVKRKILQKHIKKEKLLLREKKTYIEKRFKSLYRHLHRHKMQLLIVSGYSVRFHTEGT